VTAPADEDAARVRRTVATVKAGYLGRAVKGLQSTGIADTADAAVLRQLQALHPPASAPAPPLPHSVPLVAVDEGVLARLVRKRLCNGAAPGPSGWTGELIAPLLRDEACARSLCILIADILNGVLSVAEREYLLASRLIAVKKGESGIRPIAIGEVFTKLAGLYALSQVAGCLPAIFEPIQLGVGAAGGPERAVHLIRAAIEATHPDSVVLLTDARNAFNACHRSDMLAAVYSHPGLQTAWRLFDWAYNAPSKLLLTRGEEVVGVLASAEGVRQGDALAMLGFGATAQPCYQQAVAGLPDLEAVAIADDFSLIGSPASVFTAFRRFKPAAEQRGIVLQLPKCAVLWAHAHDPPQHIVDECEALGIQLVCGSTTVLGAMVGCDDAKAAEWVMQAVRDHEGLFRDLQRSDMPCQIAALLLRVCALPRVGYLTRVMPPSATAAALDVFDGMVTATVAEKLGLPPGPVSNEVSTLIHLPVRLAGLGLRSQSATAPIAYLASLAQAAQDVCRVKSARPDSLTLVTDANVFDSYRRIVATGYFGRERDEDAIQLPGEAGQFLEHFREGGARSLQHALLEDVEKAAYNALFEEASPEARARLLSCSGTGAGAWITAIPTEAEYVMPDDSYRYAVRLRLGLPPSETLPPVCVCGASLTAYGNHFLVCQLLFATSTTTRHDRLVRTFAALAREGGAIVIVEPSCESERPDAEITWADGIDLVDVSVTHAGQSALTRGSARGQLRAAEVRERRKIAHYTDMARRTGARFVPLVFETYGAFATHTQDYVGKLSLAHASQPGGSDLPDQRGRIMQRLAVALQNGNARVQEEGLRRARHRARGGCPWSRQLRR
jgi:hypothetical protein